MSPETNWSFLVDENTSRSLVPALQKAGHRAVHVYDTGLQGYPDPEVFDHVYDLDYYFYPASQLDNHQQDNVSFEVARSICSRFIPPDSKLISTNANKSDPSLADGLQYIYNSRSTKNSVPGK